MDIQTIHRRLLHDVKRKTQADSDQAMMALIDAMRHYRRREFHFNKGWQQVFFPADTNRLVAPIAPIGVPVTRDGIPHGLIRPVVIQIVAIVESGNVFEDGIFEYQQYDGEPLIEIDAKDMWSLLGGTGQLVKGEGTGDMPTHYCWIDGPIPTIRIYPQPAVDLLADVYGTEDSHIPRYRWTGSAWAFEALKTSVAAVSGQFWEWAQMAGTFENLWTNHADQLIRAWARHYLYTNFYGDKNNALLAQGQLAGEEDSALLDKVASYGGNLSIRPSCL
jgi:hypothetical protein